MFDYFVNKRFLITGHNGFKGSWLTAILRELGAHTTGLSNGNSSSSLYLNNVSFRPHVEVNLDIRNKNALVDFANESDFNGIFHLAAQSLVQKSYEIPLETFETNVLGSAYLLESTVGKENLEFLLCATTDKVYSFSGANQPYKENDQLGCGEDPYSASKTSLELMLKTWKNCFPNNIARKIIIARAGNVIGGGDISENRLMPDVVRSVENSSKLLVRNPSSIRPWQHVLDPLFGYLLYAQALALKSPLSSALNFGPAPESALTVLDMVKYAKRISSNLEYDLNVVTDNFGKETEWLNLDSRKAFVELGWKSLLTPYEAIEWTLEWHHQTILQNCEYITKEQISNYLELITANSH